MVKGKTQKSSMVSDGKALDLIVLSVYLIKVAQTKEEKAAYLKAYRQANKAKIAAYNASPEGKAKRAAYRASPEGKAKDRQAHVRRSYGLPPKQVEAILLDQAYCCKICVSPPKKGKVLNVDHCHETGLFRGILCTSCNVGLGRFDDNVEGLTRALSYVTASYTVPDGIYPVREYTKREATKNNKLKRNYGIMLAQFEAMLKEQAGVCKICASGPRTKGRSLAVDHCHETGNVRGLLCIKCNRGLGQLGDNEFGIRRAIRYLKGEL